MSDPRLELSESVEQLSALLKMLYPASDPDLTDVPDDAPLINPDILTLDSFKRRYQLTGLGALAVTAIEQAQRITRDIGNFEDMGLCEFHIGLIYLHCEDFRGAAQQFREAWQQWSYVDKTAATRLAYLAEGVALHYAHAYEAALGLYGKAEQMKRRIHLEPSPDSRDAFLQQFDDWLQLLQQAARTALEKQTTPNEEIGETVDSYPNAEICSGCAWYKVDKANVQFLPSIREGDWLIVNEQITDYAYKSNDLIIVLWDFVSDESIVLRPSQPTQQFARILLAKVNLAGSWSRSIDTGEVLLSVNESLSINRNEIKGVVVGWQMATTS